MVTNFPSALDNFTNPGTGDYEDVLSHAAQHSNANDAIEAIEAVLGTTAGTALFNGYTAAQKPVKEAGGTVSSYTYSSGTFTNPRVNGGTWSGGTLGSVNLLSPIITTGSDAVGDMYYRTGGGTLARLAIGSAGKYLVSMGTEPGWSAISFSGAKVYKAGTQTVGSGAWTAVTFDTEEFDTDGYHGTTNTSRLTVSQTGYYHVIGNLSFENNATGFRGLRMTRNGTFSSLSAAERLLSNNGDGWYVSISNIWSLAANDYVSLEVYQTSGGSLGIDPTATNFSIHKIG